MAQDVTQLVPSVVGLSLTLGDHGLTLTLVASDEVAAALDGVQHLFGGPAVEAALDGRESDVADPLSEERWAEYARSMSSNGVRSSLSLPLGAGGLLTGALTLYAALPSAFAGHEPALRRVLGVTEGISIADGDLPFRTLADAREGPQRLEDHGVVERAVGFVALGRDRRGPRAAPGRRAPGGGRRARPGPRRAARRPRGVTRSTRARSRGPGVEG